MIDWASKYSILDENQSHTNHALNQLIEQNGILGPVISPLFQNQTQWVDLAFSFRTDIPAS